LNRSVESRSGKGAFGVPQLSNLRDSGQIEQDADVIIFLHDFLRAGEQKIPDKWKP